MREAIVNLHDRDLRAVGLGAAADALRDAGLRDLTELDPDGVHKVRVDEPIPDARLDGLDCLEWWERVDASGSGATYLWKLEVPGCAGDCPLDDHSTAYEVVGVREGGFALSVVGSHGAISRAVEGMRDAGVTVGLERLTEYRGSASTTDRLTDRQREVVRTAYRLGYYDVPRRASTDGVAAELGLDPSTVAEHLQRAERNIVDDVLVPAE